MTCPRPDGIFMITVLLAVSGIRGQFAQARRGMMTDTFCERIGQQSFAHRNTNPSVAARVASRSR